MNDDHGNAPGHGSGPGSGHESGHRSSDGSVEQRLVDLLGHLVGFATVSRTPNQILQEWLAERLEERSAQVRIVPGRASGRANLLATIGPDEPGGLLLSGHTDVVDPGHGWSSDPWVLTPIGDRLFGRGTADMKGFFAASMVALGSIDPQRLAAPIHIVASYDEEIGCQGVRDILPELRASLRPELVLIGEPTMMRPRHSHLGKQLYRVAMRAQAGHSSRAGSMPSAINAAAELVAKLAEVQAGCPRHADDGSPPYSLNCGTIAGGTAPNVIAAQCDLDFEVRHDVEHDPDDLLRPVFDALTRIDASLAAAGGGAVCELTTSYPAMATDVSSAAFERAVRLADAGPASALGYGTEGGLLATAIDAPIMICGPGDIADAHRPDEFVSIQQLTRCVAVVSRLIESFCVRQPQP